MLNMCHIAKLLISSSWSFMCIV